MNNYRQLIEDVWRTAKAQPFNAAGVLFACIAAYCAVADKGDSWPIALLSVVFFLFGNLERFESLKAGPDGVEAKLKQALKTTNDQIQELREIALLFGNATISNVAIMGRWDGFTDSQKEKIITEIVTYFDKVGVTEAEKNAALDFYHRTIEHDYRILCTGGSYIPKDLTAEHKAAWESIRGGGLDLISSPDQIRDFFNHAGMMNEQRSELIEDYRFYIENRRHRRPEVWASRHDIFGY